MDRDLQILLNSFDDTLKVIRSYYVWATAVPQAKQSTQFGRGRAWTPPKKRAYLKGLSDQFEQTYSGPRLYGLFRVTVLFCFPWRQSDKAVRQLGWSLADHRVDLDNLWKPVADTLQKVCISDDCRIIESRARKIRYSTGCVAVRLDEVQASRG